MRAYPLAAALCATLALSACAEDDMHGDGGGYYGHRDNGYAIHDEDRIYRDNEGRYYCRRSDGSTGTIVGGIAGGVLGNIIAPGDSKTLGTILGAAGGALAGRSIDRRKIRCQ